MKLSKKLFNYSFAIIAELAIIGILIGTAFDREITGKLGDYSNLFGILFTAFGTMGTLTIGAFAGIVLFFMPKHQNNKLDVISRIIGAVAFLGFTAFEVKEAFAFTNFPRMEAEAETYRALIATLIGLISLAMILFTKLYIHKLDAKAIIPVCFMIIIIIVGYAAATEATKYFASRPRPRVIDLHIADFRQWYQFHPFEAFKEPFKDCKSWVSGHSANAACMISVLPLVLSLRKEDNTLTVQLIAIIVGALYAFVTAISSVIARAHFTSDVMSGILVSIIIQVLVLNISRKVLEKH